MYTFMFHMMRTFRWLFVWSVKLMSFFCVILFLIAIFADDPKVTGVDKVIVWFVLALGLGAFAWYYDVLLKKLAPVDQSNQDWS